MFLIVRILLALSTTLGLALAVPTLATGRTTEIGSPTAQGGPSCPTRPCLAVTRTTGFQVQAAGRGNPYLAPRAGRIVALTVALGRPSRSQTDFFDSRMGGKASLRVAILRPYRRRRNNLRFVVRAQTEPLQLSS